MIFIGRDCPAALLVVIVADDLSFPTTGRPSLGKEAIGAIGDVKLTLVLELNGIELFDCCKRNHIVSTRYYCKRSNDLIFFP